LHLQRSGRSVRVRARGDCVRALNESGAPNVESGDLRRVYAAGRGGPKPRFLLLFHWYSIVISAAASRAAAQNRSCRARSIVFSL
jgi:hypothetical protein